MATPPRSPGSATTRPTTARRAPREVLGGGPAEAGARSLADTVEGIQARNDGHLTVAGHSYGSVTTGLAAAREGMRPDELILTGSPGAGEGVEHASELGDARQVHVAAAPHDIVADDPLGVHGPDPSAPDFGAQPIPTDPAPVDPVEVYPSPSGPVAVPRPDVYFTQRQAPYYEPRTMAFREIVRIVSGAHGAAAP